MKIFDNAKISAICGYTDVGGQFNRSLKQYRFLKYSLSLKLVKI